MRVSQNDTNLRGRGTLPGELADLLDDLLGGGLQPCRRGARVRDRGGRNALAVAVKSTHFGGVEVVLEKEDLTAGWVKFVKMRIVWSTEIFA